MGWIKLHRKSLDHWLYNENRPHTKREAWEDILLLCNHSDEKILIGNQLIECKRGQSIRSLQTWAKLFRWNKSKIRRFFILLEKENMIRTENVQKSTRITVCKYEFYQGERNNDETMMKRKRNDDETRATPNKKYKEDKEEKNAEVFSFVKKFISYVKKEFPKKQPRGENIEDKSYESVMKLIEKDGFTLKEIRNTLLMAREDDFWKDQVYSLVALRKKNDSGLTKFQNMYNKFSKEEEKKIYRA